MHNEGKPFNISYEFYVSSSSKDLLKYLQQIMRKNGYLGLADGGGRLHYVLDGTKNLYETAHNIEKLVFGDTQGSSYYQKQIEIEVEKMSSFLFIQDYLVKIGLKPSLKGYVYLCHLLLILMDESKGVNAPDKTHFSTLADYYQTGRQQIDRNIDYALKKAGYNETNSVFIARILQEIKKALEEKSEI